MAPGTAHPDPWKSFQQSKGSSVALIIQSRTEKFVNNMISDVMIALGDAPDMGRLMAGCIRSSYRRINRISHPGLYRSGRSGECKGSQWLQGQQLSGACGCLSRTPAWIPSKIGKAVRDGVNFSDSRPSTDYQVNTVEYVPVYQKGMEQKNKQPSSRWSFQITINR